MPGMGGVDLTPEEVAEYDRIIQPAHDLSAAELAELMAFVRKATPIIDELAEHMPGIRQLAAMGAQMAQGGPGAIMGLLRGTPAAPR